MDLNIVFPHQHPKWEALKESLEGLVEVETITEAWTHLAHIHQIYNDLPKTDVIKRQSVFAGLLQFMSQRAEDEEIMTFVQKILPTIAKLVLDCPKIQPDPPLEIVQKQQDKTVTLSRHFVACIVACGFLCLFEDLEEKHDLTMPSVNFSNFFRIKDNDAKLRMILNYFTRLSDGIPEGHITFRRVVLDDAQKLTADKILQSNKDLCALFVDDDMTIEDGGKNVLQVDFANEYLGGGVLYGGNVQEEIRFSVCPELLSSMLFMESMADNEAVIIHGFEQFSHYAGYGGSLQFAGNCDDSKAKGDNGEFLTTLCAIDAVPYSTMGTLSQFKIENVLRDVNKAYIGFLQPYAQKWKDDLPTLRDIKSACELPPDKIRTVMSGNWGCGVFGGDAKLKSLLQWIAASQAGCPALVYCSFHDENIAGLEEMKSFIVDHHLNVSDLMKLVMQYGEELYKKEDEMEDDIFEFIVHKFSPEDRDADSSENRDDGVEDMVMSQQEDDRT